MKLIAGSEEVQLPNPQWGFSTEIHMALSMTRNPNNGSVKAWDNGVANDYRLCSAKWILTQAELETVHNFLTNPSYGRCSSFFLDVGSSGFMPFGPDKVSDMFAINELTHDRGGRQIRPFNRYEFNMSFLLRSVTAAELPAQISQGSLRIGTVSGLPFIHSPKITYTKGWKTDITNGGLPAHLDNSINSSYVDSEVSFEVNKSNAAALINYLANTGRGGDIEISTPANSYLFGAENGSFGTYIVQLTDNIIKVTHGAVTRFAFNLKFHLKSRAS